VKPLSRRSSRTTLGAEEGEESLQHNAGVPYGTSDDPVVRASVLLRPPGEALHVVRPVRATRHQPARRAAHKIRNTCYNEKSYECNMFAVS
jgi:hypothetical protein